MAHSLLQHVRQRYKYCCGYCGVSEADAAGELTVDHFVPIRSGGADNLDNPVYSCVRCNQYKGALVPDNGDRSLIAKLLHPLHDDIQEHIREDEITGLLVGLTVSGMFYIDALRLNREPLLVNRQRRRLMALLDARLMQANTENHALKLRLVQMERYISYLEARLLDLK